MSTAPCIACKAQVILSAHDGFTIEECKGCGYVGRPRATAPLLPPTRYDRKHKRHVQTGIVRGMTEERRQEISRMGSEAAKKAREERKRNMPPILVGKFTNQRAPKP